MTLPWQNNVYAKETGQANGSWFCPGCLCSSINCSLAEFPNVTAAVCATTLAESLGWRSLGKGEQREVLNAAVEKGPCSLSWGEPVECYLSKPRRDQHGLNS